MITLPKVDSISFAEIHQWYEDNHSTKNLTLDEVRQTPYELLAKWMTPAEIAAARMTKQELQDWTKNHRCTYTCTRCESNITTSPTRICGECWREL